MAPLGLTCWVLPLCLWWLPSDQATPSGRARLRQGDNNVGLSAGASLPLTPGALPSGPVGQQVSSHPARSILLTPTRAADAAAYHIVSPGTAPTPIPTLVTSGKDNNSPRLMRTSLIRAIDPAVASFTTIPSTVTLATTAPTFTSVFETPTSLVALNSTVIRYVPHSAILYSILEAPFRDCPNECEVRLHETGECELDFACHFLMRVVESD
ncbi:uncharacterized protein [Panulirus ornatus]|uniref:uncharacterized protein n=1 Tax=Panulirus ornatus TaxID=150431 RepID=UPI003A860F23